MSVIVCGDIHGKWGPINTLINQKHPDIILQCGDFGWWPHFHGKTGLGSGIFDQYGIRNGSTKIYWAPGNHENWDDLDKYGYSITEVAQNVFYCPFGSTITLPNDDVVMFCGGARSIDADSRIEGISWWRQEVITRQDFNHLLDEVSVPNVDIMISHTVPNSFIEAAKWDRFNVEKYRDSSTTALQAIFEIYKPKRWFSGHFHNWKKMLIGGCRWESLTIPGDGTWWTYLDK